VATPLSEIFTSARDRHRSFHKSRVPDGVLARVLKEYINELIPRAAARDRQYVKQSVQIVFQLGSASAVGTSGAGTTGGFAGVPDGSGGFETVNAPVGSLVTAGVTAAEGATVILDEQVVTSATANSLTCSAVTRSVNADIGKVLVITAGKGVGQRRDVLSNTAHAWTISTGSDGESWATIPDTTSVFALVTPAYTADEAMGVVLDLPASVQTQGYLVKLDANGLPFIDFGTPLVASTDAGVPLPQAFAYLDGTCYYVDGDRDPLAFISESDRYDPPRWPAVYTVGAVLHFAGHRADWLDAASLDIRYVPLQPKFVALTDYVILPDAAMPCLVAKLASFMAAHVNGSAGVVIDPAVHAATAAAAEAAYLSSIRLTRSGRRVRFRAGEI
jgi:hypothetical protein